MADADNVIDNFELINCIATGNATSIWEVKHGGNGQAYAMKLLLPESLKNADAKASLKHEFNVGKSINHPNIIQFFDLKFTKTYGYFTMEHIRSGNLKAMIRYEPDLAQARCKKVMECLTQALAVMHGKNWIHRDLKPENVLVTKTGEVKLIDFSLASRPTGILAKALTRKSKVVIQGTRTYIAPELVQRLPLTFSADIYSLGILFYEILTGNPPFRTANPNELLMMHVRDKPVTPSDLNSNVSPEVDAVVLKMLAKKPADRYKSMQDLAKDIQNMRFFKEDPELHAKVKAEKAEASQKVSVDVRLDSRADAERQRMISEGLISPDEQPKPKKKAKPSPALLKEMQQKDAAKSNKNKGKAPAAQAPAQPPAQPMPQFPMQPGYGMPMQGMPMPGMQMPVMPFSGMPIQGMPPGMPQGMPIQAMGQQPGLPPQMQPRPGMPPQGMPAAANPQPLSGPPQTVPRPGMPVPGLTQQQPPAAQPQQPVPPRPVAPAAAPASQPVRPVPPVAAQPPRPVVQAPPLAQPPRPAAPAPAAVQPPRPAAPVPAAPSPAAPARPLPSAAQPAKKEEESPLASMDDFDFT